MERHGSQKLLLLLILFAVSTQLSSGSSRVASWGYYWKSKSNIFQPVSAPPMLNDTIAVAGGAGHSLALLANGTVVGWGDNTFGQINVPFGLTGVVAIAAGDYHSLALTSDGAVVAWGDNTDGQTSVPASLTNVIAISGAFFHSLALRADGTVVAWGGTGRILDIPPDLSNVVAIASRNVHSLALKADGTAVEWGLSGLEQVPRDLTNGISIALGESHSLALTADGRVIAWGENSFGKAMVPSGLSNVVSVAAGAVHNLALLGNDAVIAWGAGTNVDLSTGGDYGQSIVPANLTNVAAVGGGSLHSLALLRDGPPVLFSLAVNRTVLFGSTAWLTVPVTAVPPLAYQWSFNGTNLPGGTNAVLTLESLTFANQGVYSLFVSNQFGVASSSNMSVNVTVAPLFITIQPQSQTFLVGSMMTLIVGATGQRPFSYQWQFNGSDIPGATDDAFLLAAAKISDSGIYSVIVSNSAGAVRSADAVVSINDHAVVSWGNNFFPSASGRLNLTNIVAVSGGYVHILALQADGKVLAWGEDYWGQTNVPANLTNVVAVAAGLVHSLALRADGKVVAWGSNSAGQGTVPGGLDNVVAISACNHNLALKANGTVVAWGYNYGPGLSYGGQTDVPPGLSNVVAVGAGQYYSLALKADGQVVAWGAIYSTLAPPPNLTNIVAIAAGASHALALRADGTVAVWGDNGYGQSAVPSDLTNVIAIAAGNYHSLALKSDGTVVAWGTGNYGQVPVPFGLTNVTAIAAGSFQSIAIVGGGRPFLNAPLVDRFAIYGQTVSFHVTAQGAGPLHYQWIYNGTNVSGATNATLILSNVQFADAGKYFVRVSNAFGEVVSSEMVFSVAPLLITAHPQNQGTFLGGTVQFNVTVSGAGPIRYQWLFNGTDIPGAIDSQLALRNLRIENSGLYSVLVSNAVGSAISDGAVLSVGEVIAWGDNGLIATNLPFGLTNITAIAAGGDHNLALRADGTVIAWGEQAGTNVPAGLTNVVAISAGTTHGVALKGDTTVVAWGLNDVGQLRVPAGLSNVVAIAAGSAHTLALRADRTVRAWGNNDYGQIRVPSGLTNVIAISAGISDSFALKADGTITVWGDNSFGTSIPPSGLSNVIAISSGWQHTAALKADGTVVVWGASYAGQTNLPVGLNNVVAISAGANHTLAMKADKTLVAGGSFGSTTIPSLVTNVRSFRAGYVDDLALLGDTPLIVTQPVGLTVTESSNATVAVAVTGVPSPSYQWRREGVAIPGATDSALTFQNVQLNSGGLYSVTVSNAFGVRTSSNALLTVLPLNHPPVARCTNVVTIAGADCIAATSVDSGSFDPDGDPIAITQLPPGPYSPGTNTVLLLVSDNKSATNSCLAKVIVLDMTPPAINCPPDIVLTNAHAAWVSIVTFAPTGSDNCPGLSGIISTPPSGSQFGLGTHRVLCSVSDAAGNASQCSFRVKVLPGNVPPLPIIEVSPLAHFGGDTNLIVIAGNNTNATAMFDGSKSYDLDDTNFLYFWFEGESLFSTRSGDTRVLALGTHLITLSLDDTFPLGTNSASVKVEVISASQAVATLIEMVDGSNLAARSKSPLDAMLKSAAAAFERKSGNSGVAVLLAFESRVKAKVAPSDAVLATQLVAAVESILHAVGPSHLRPSGSEVSKDRVAKEQ